MRRGHLLCNVVTQLLFSIALGSEPLSLSEAENVLSQHFDAERFIREKRLREKEAKEAPGIDVFALTDGVADELAGRYNASVEGYRRNGVVLMQDSDAWMFAREEVVDTSEPTDQEPWQATWNAIRLDTADTVSMAMSDINGTTVTEVHLSGSLQGRYSYVTARRMLVSNDESSTLMHDGTSWVLQSLNTVIRAAAGNEDSPIDADWNRRSFVVVDGPIDAQGHYAGNGDAQWHDYSHGRYRMRRGNDDPRRWQLVRREELLRSSSGRHGVPWEATWDGVAVTRSGENMDVKHRLMGMSRKRANQKVRFQDALTNALVPKAGISTCINLNVDLAPLGVVGLFVDVGLRGDLLYSVCRDCFEWNFEVKLSFAYGLKVFGKGLFLKLSLSSDANLKEVICDEAPQSLYCQYLHVFLPSERGIEPNNRYSRCHSNSPFDIVMAYIKHRWQSFGYHWASHGVRGLYSDSDPNASDNVDRIKGFDKDLTQRIHALEEDMLSYQRVFTPRKPPKTHMTADMQEKMWKSLPALKKSYVFGSLRSLNLLRMDVQRFQNPKLCWSTDGTCNKIGRDVVDFDHLNLNDVTSFVSVGRTLRAWIHGRRRYGERHHGYVRNYVDWKMRSAKDADEAMKDLQEALEYWRNEVPKKVLKVHVHRGHIANTNGRHHLDLRGKPDPFVEVMINGQTWSTSIVMDSEDPEWDEIGSFVLAANTGMNDPIEVSFRVFDFDWHIHHRDFAGYTASQVFGRGSNITGHAGDFHTGLYPPSCTFGSLFVKGSNVGGIYQLVNATFPRQWRRGDTVLRHIDGTHGLTRWAFVSDHGKIFAQSASFNKTSAITFSNAEWNNTVSFKHILTAADIPGNEAKTVYLPLMDEHGVGVSVDWLEVSFELMMPPIHFVQDGSDAPYKKYPQTAEVFEAQHAAFEQFIGKVARYAEQVSEQLVENDQKVDAQWELNDEESNGRFLARNYFRAQVLEMELKEGMDDTTYSRNHWKNFWIKIRRKLRDVKDVILKDNPCATVKEKTDYRVVNIDNVLHRSKHRLGGGKVPLDFYAEVATSIGNLYTRVVTDVQGLFNMYFADDPNFDGDCLTAWPKHQLPLEFTDEKTNDYATQVKNATSWARFKTRGSVRAEGKKETRASNNLCDRAWASGDIEPQRRTLFATVSPPTNDGKYSFVTPHQELNSTMLSQFWCALVSHKENVNIGYQSSCRQLTSEFNDQGELVTKPWRRYDCEQGTVQPSFFAFLPKLAKKILDTRTRIGQRMEDILMCVSRLTMIQREFLFSDEMRGYALPADCSVTLYEFHNKYMNPASRHYDPEANKVMVAFVRNETINILNELRDFMWFLETQTDDLQRDYKAATQLWDLGPHQVFLGDAYAHFDKTAAEFSDKAKLEHRMALMKDRVVQKAWDSSTAYFLFPPPITFSETFQMEFGIVLGIPDMCKALHQYREKGTDLAFSKIWEGYTWQPDYQTNSTNCWTVAIRPLERLFAKISRCTTNHDVLTWKINVFGIISLNHEHANKTDAASFTDDLKGKLSDIAMTTVSDHGPVADLKKFKTTTDATWQVIKEAIDSDIFSGDYSKLSEYAFMKYFKRVVAKMKAKAKDFETKIVSDLGSKLSSVMKALDIQKYDYRTLHAGIDITRKGAHAKWDKKFEVTYKRTKMTEVKLEIPSQVAPDSSFAWTLEWDISDLFNVIFGVEKSSDENCLPPYDLCVQCLGQVHRNKNGELIRPVACIGPKSQGYPIDCRNGTGSGSPSAPCLPDYDVIEDQIECATHQKFDDDIAFGSTCAADVGQTSFFSDKPDGTNVSNKNQWSETSAEHEHGLRQDDVDSFPATSETSYDDGLYTIIARQLQAKKKGDEHWPAWVVSLSTVAAILSVQTLGMAAFRLWRM
eukprot:GEMP01000540.1.p1 GENE.GEMP01000540.1~~GEMP01000540.1.p1  ORF type:complete len:1878 (+),score=433.64 GEMP01000540.1:264-5897(+)